MVRYETIRSYWVIDEIKNGKKVYVLDRKNRTVHLVNVAPVGDVIKAIESEEEGRYIYWSETEVADEVTEETESDNG